MLETRREHDVRLGALPGHLARAGRRGREVRERLQGRPPRLDASRPPLSGAEAGQPTRPSPRPRLGRSLLMSEALEVPEVSPAARWTMSKAIERAGGHMRLEACHALRADVRVVARAGRQLQAIARPGARPRSPRPAGRTGWTRVRTRGPCRSRARGRRSGRAARWTRRRARRPSRAKALAGIAVIGSSADRHADDAADGVGDRRGGRADATWRTPQNISPRPVSRLTPAPTANSATRLSPRLATNAAEPPPHRYGSTGSPHRSRTRGTSRPPRPTASPARRDRAPAPRGRACRAPLRVLEHAARRRGPPRRAGSPCAR